MQKVESYFRCFYHCYGTRCRSRLRPRFRRYAGKHGRHGTGSPRFGFFPPSGAKVLWSIRTRLAPGSQTGYLYKAIVLASNFSYSSTIPGHKLRKQLEDLRHFISESAHDHKNWRSRTCRSGNQELFRA